MPSPGGLIVPGDKEFHFGPREVNQLHAYDDLDTGPDAHHHSLGTGPHQAAQGNHRHWGNWVNLATLHSYNASLIDFPGGQWQIPQMRWTADRMEYQMRGLIRTSAAATLAAGAVMFTLAANETPIQNHLFGSGTDSGGVQGYARWDLFGTVSGGTSGQAIYQGPTNPIAANAFINLQSWWSRR